MRLGHDVLAQVTGLTTGGRVEQAPVRASLPLGPTQRYQLQPRRPGQRVRCGQKRGETTGLNPTDRSKLGTKRHVLTDANGVPLALGPLPSRLETQEHPAPHGPARGREQRPFGAAKVGRGTHPGLTKEQNADGRAVVLHFAPDRPSVGQAQCSHKEAAPAPADKLGAGSTRFTRPRGCDNSPARR